MANKIIVVSGPHEGVGKSCLAANLATAHAQLRRQPAVLIDTDFLCRGETGQLAGTSSSLTVHQVLEMLANRELSLPMLRGKISFNRFNVGLLNLAAASRQVETIKPEQWIFFLENFSQLYDIFIDIEVFHALKMASFEVADAIIWTFLPQGMSLKGTLQHLEWFGTQKIPSEKLFLALNQSDSPGALSRETVEGSLDQHHRGIDVTLPSDANIPRLVNQGQPAVLALIRPPYYLKATELADKVFRIQKKSAPLKPGPATTNTVAKDGVIRASGPAVVDVMLEEKRKRWNTFKQQIHRDLVEELNIRRIDLDTKGDPARERQLRTNVESTVNSLISRDNQLDLPREERDRLVKELVDEALGLGPLEELLADPTITEIMVNRFDQVFIERRGKIILSDKRFLDNNHVVQVVRRIIAPLGRRIDESIPMVDARLKDGSRVNAIIPPLAVQGPSVTIRRFPEKAFSSEDLINMGAISREMIEFLKICVLTKKNMVIAGGTGTGKTTILNLLSGFIPGDERIVTVEDTAELRLQQEHLVRLEARPANIEGHGAVAIRDLVKNCLRMRPDRIVVGECRGGEALDMLQAMNTGHDGSLTTIHANSPRDCFTRLETLCLMAGMDLPVWALREQIRSAVHVVIQLSRLQDGSRKVTCITEVIGRNEETILTQDLFRYVQEGVDKEGRVFGHHESTGIIPKFYPELKAKGLALNLEAFKK